MEHVTGKRGQSVVGNVTKSGSIAIVADAEASYGRKYSFRAPPGSVASTKAYSQ